MPIYGVYSHIEIDKEERPRYDTFLGSRAEYLFTIEEENAWLADVQLSDMRAGLVENPPLEVLRGKNLYLGGQVWGRR
jgi:hypothetical protein